MLAKVVILSVVIASEVVSLLILGLVWIELRSVQQMGCHWQYFVKT